MSCPGLFEEENVEAFGEQLGVDLQGGEEESVSFSRHWRRTPPAHLSWYRLADETRGPRRLGSRGPAMPSTP